MALNLNDRTIKFELLKRSLGLKHKLKVHESIEAPKNHDELSNYLLAKWELEDELHAIEAVLTDVRTQSTIDWKRKIESMGLAAIHMKTPEKETDSELLTEEASSELATKIEKNDSSALAATAPAGGKKPKRRANTNEPEQAI